MWGVDARVGFVKVNGSPCERWLAVRALGSAQFGTLVVVPKVVKKTFFWDGLPPLSSCTSGISKVAWTPRKHGLHGDRIGEAEKPGPVMEAPVRAFSGAVEMVSLQERLVHAVDPELTKDQGDWDSQEGELDARVLAPLCSSADAPNLVLRRDV